MLDLLDSFLDELLSLDLVLHLSVEGGVLFFLHHLLTLPLVQDLVLSFFGAKMSFNGHSVNHLSDASSLLVLLHLTGDGLVEFCDLLLAVHVLMCDHSLLVLDV